MDVFQFEAGILLVVHLGLLAVKGFAFVNALTFPAQAYTAADKLTKTAWSAILGLALAFQIVFVGSFSIFQIAFTIAAFVYLADVRPALAGMTRR